MVFNDEERAKRYLSNISYYRLKAYWYPYRDLSDPDENFKESISFEKALNIYVFDRELFKSKKVFDYLQSKAVSDIINTTLI